MKKLITICAVVTMILAVNNLAQADVDLSGILSGVDSNAVKDDGDGNHDYAIDRTAANTFYWSAGSTVSITGTVDVRDLTAGSYLQVGLVDKAYADMSLDYYGWGGYMFNDSAFATFYSFCHHVRRNCCSFVSESIIVVISNCYFTAIQVQSSSSNFYFPIFFSCPIDATNYFICDSFIF